MKVRSRGIVEVKGKGDMELFLLADSAAAVSECLGATLSRRQSRTRGSRRIESEGGEKIVCAQPPLLTPSPEPHEGPSRLTTGWQRDPLLLRLQEGSLRKADRSYYADMGMASLADDNELQILEEQLGAEWHNDLIQQPCQAEPQGGRRSMSLASMPPSLPSGGEHGDHNLLRLTPQQRAA